MAKHVTVDNLKYFYQKLQDNTATTNRAGFMSTDDKNKLDGIDDAITDTVNSITPDSSLSSTSEKPVQNKVLYSKFNSIMEDPYISVYDRYKVDARFGELALFTGKNFVSNYAVINTVTNDDETTTTTTTYETSKWESSNTNYAINVGDGAAVTKFVAETDSDGDKVVHISGTKAYADIPLDFNTHTAFEFELKNVQSDSVIASWYPVTADNTIQAMKIYINSSGYICIDAEYAVITSGVLTPKTVTRSTYLNASTITKMYVEINGSNIYVYNESTRKTSISFPFRLGVDADGNQVSRAASPRVYLGWDGVTDPGETKTITVTTTTTEEDGTTLSSDTEESVRTAVDIIAFRVLNLDISKNAFDAYINELIDAKIDEYKASLVEMSTDSSASGETT